MFHASKQVNRCQTPEQQDVTHSPSHHLPSQKTVDLSHGEAQLLSTYQKPLTPQTEPRWSSWYHINWTGRDYIQELLMLVQKDTQSGSTRREWEPSCRCRRTQQVVGMCSLTDRIGFCTLATLNLETLLQTGQGSQQTETTLVVKQLGKAQHSTDLVCIPV